MRPNEIDRRGVVSMNKWSMLMYFNVQIETFPNLAMAESSPELRVATKAGSRQSLSLSSRSSARLVKCPQISLKSAMVEHTR